MVLFLYTTSYDSSLTAVSGPGEDAQCAAGGMHATIDGHCIEV
jgi:hypothetical protein